MSSANRPDRLTCDAFSDPNIKSNPNSGIYNRFTNTLAQPIVGVKGIQLLRTNFVNSVLQLNDYNGQLFFLYYKYSDATVSGIALANMHCVRLHPSWYIPKTGYATYVRNQYFNSVADLVTALNSAASTSGDLTTYNPTWLVNDVSFSYDTATRRISFTGLTASSYYSPVAYDDPNVALFFANNNSYTPKMNGYTSSSTYATATYQPWVLGNTMNPRLGFGMAYSTKGRWANGASILGCANDMQLPQAQNIATQADSYPILIGAQNLNIYCNILGPSGQSSVGRKNLLACIPLEYASLNVCAYTLTSVEGHALSFSNELYELSFEFTDDAGNPFYFNPNMNTQLEMNVFYYKPTVSENGQYYPSTKSVFPPKLLK